MAHLITVPSISSSFSDYLYKTEYQCSFVDYVRRSEPRSKIQQSSSYEKHMNTSSYDKAFSKENHVAKQTFLPSTSSSQCSIGVQTDEKKVKFDLTPRNINKKETFLEKPRIQRIKETQTLDEKVFNTQSIDQHKDAERNTSLCSYEEKPKPSMQNNCTSNDERTIIPYSLNLVAGKDSENYQRAPFIQKKKKISSPVSPNLPNEPALQKKKIIPYFKNHNILRTSTVSEEKSQTKDDNFYSYHRKMISPEMYKSSYECEFTFIPLTVSPLLSADITISDYRDSPSKCQNDIRGSLSYNSGVYDKSNYESEYNHQFSPKECKENLVANTNNKHFSEYYQQVLDKRQVAYKPFLAWENINRHNSVWNIYQEDLRSKQFEVEDPTPQKFRNGRYTRAYRPEMYT